MPVVTPPQSIWDAVDAAAHLTVVAKQKAEPGIAEVCSAKGVSAVPLKLLQHAIGEVEGREKGAAAAQVRGV